MHTVKLRHKFLVMEINPEIRADGPGEAERDALAEVAYPLNWETIGVFIAY